MQTNESAVVVYHVTLALLMAWLLHYLNTNTQCWKDRDTWKYICTKHCEGRRLLVFATTSRMAWIFKTW